MSDQWTSADQPPPNEYFGRSRNVLIAWKPKYQEIPDYYIGWYDHDTLRYRNVFGEINATFWVDLPPLDATRYCDECGGDAAFVMEISFGCASCAAQ